MLVPRVGKGGGAKAGGLVTKEDKAFRGSELTKQVRGAVILALTVSQHHGELPK